MHATLLLVRSACQERVERLTPHRAAGILNPNRRHDDPEEQRNDMIRAEINASHRFHSFAAERSQNFVKWSVNFVSRLCRRGAETFST